MLLEPTDLRIEVLPDPHGVLLRLIGPIDTKSADLLVTDANRLVQQGHRHLILDCEELTFCDSDGLRALKTLAEQVQPDGSVTIDSPPKGLTRLLELADMTADFTLTGDTD